MDSARLGQPRSARKAELQTWVFWFSASSALAMEHGDGRKGAMPEPVRHVFSGLCGLPEHVIVWAIAV